MHALPALRGLYAILNIPYRGSLSPSAALGAMIQGGAIWVQLRAKGLSSEARLKLALELAPQCRAQGVGFAVNDDLETAIAAKADLVHVGQEDLAEDPGLYDRAKAAGLGIGLSTHSYEQFCAAQTRAWSYVAVGPIFGTQSKANPEAAVGLSTLERCMGASQGPVVAIGGITERSVKQLWPLGVAAVAVISAIAGESEEQVALRCRAFEAPASLR